ncbi:MAG: TIGR01212 family radical SAM protein [Muribaculaceae bacterium]|nr:TIGR01212 family radical SAM protein [Muribaculaceae bacterium]
MNPYYKDYAEYLSERFPGMKVQKISVNAALGCPNRDGTLGTGGCIYCDNSSFTPSYCMAGDDVAVQLEKGKEFFARKYPEMKYLAYFQSFTGTYAQSADYLRTLYGKATALDDVVGLVIGTRPDTISDEVLDMLSDFNSRLPVMIEIGVETSSDRTLKLVNRNHTWNDVIGAVTRLAERKIDVGVHLIAGLPGEAGERTLQSVKDVCRLPIGSIKLHQLQIIRDTPLHKAVERGQIEVTPYTLDEYISLCKRVVSVVPRHIAIERFVASAPPSMVVSPHWGIKNYEFVNMLHSRLAERQI